MREGHLHTIEIAFISLFTVAVGFHVMRWAGGKLSTVSAGDGMVAKVGRGVLGVFTFDKGGA